MKHLDRIDEFFFGGAVKMYHFQQNSYAEEFTVMAISEQHALDFLKSFLEKSKADESGSGYLHDEWKDATLDNLPDGYRIISFDIGDVLITEVS